MTSVCSRIDSIGVFFLGDVISSNDDGTGTFAQLTLERFKVTEIFKGLPENATEVWVDPGSMTSCYSPHEPGKRYLIAGLMAAVLPDLANRSSNYRGEKKPVPQRFDPATSLVVVSGACLGSGLAAKSAEDIAFLRAWKKGTSSTRILGRLNQSRFSSVDERFPLNDATVTITGNGLDWKRATDVAGKFEFVGVAPGNYQIRFDHPDYGRSIYAEKINVPKGGCGWVESFMPTAARLRILIKDGSGRPVPNVNIDLLIENGGKFESLPLSQRSDYAGIVDVSGLPSGTYVVAMNRQGPSTRVLLPSHFSRGSFSGSWPFHYCDANDRVRPR